MRTVMIVCPYCRGTCPTDARFCIECSAAFQQVTTNTTYRLVNAPDPIASTPQAVWRRTVSIRHMMVGITGTLLVSTLLLLGILADHNPRLDTIARLLLVVGGVQLVRCTLRRQLIAGLRAAVICLALVLAIVTPWMLTVSIAAGAILVTLHLIETHRSFQRRQMPRSGPASAIISVADVATAWLSLSDGQAPVRGPCRITLV